MDEYADPNGFAVIEIRINTVVFIFSSCDDEKYDDGDYEKT